MSTVDHAAKASRMVTPEGALSSVVDLPEKRIAVAQVHATLALVEQQRIANLVALASLRIGPDEIPPLRHLAIEPHGEYDVQPVESIRKGLGL